MAMLKEKLIMKTQASVNPRSNSCPTSLCWLRYCQGTHINITLFLLDLMEYNISPLSWTRWCPQIQVISLFGRVLLTSVTHSSICPIQTQRAVSIRLTCGVAQFRSSIIGAQAGRQAGYTVRSFEEPQWLSSLANKHVEVKSSDVVLSHLEVFCLLYFILF